MATPITDEYTLNLLDREDTPTVRTVIADTLRALRADEVVDVVDQSSLIARALHAANLLPE